MVMYWFLQIGIAAKIVKSDVSEKEPDLKKSGSFFLDSLDIFGYVGCAEAVVVGRCGEN